MISKAVSQWGLTFGTAAILASAPLVGLARESNPVVRETLEARGGAVVELITLPAEAQRTYKLILVGGPFPYSKDGIVFGNREQQLPRRARGYYREYTVRTPGERDRGARRIVCGGKSKTEPVACFYTGDHYASFSRIAP